MINKNFVFIIRKMRFVNEWNKTYKIKGALGKVIKKIGNRIDDILILLCRKIFGVKNNIMVLESEGDFTDNVKAFYDYLLENKINERIQIVWFVHNPKQYIKLKNVKFISRYKFINFKADYYIARTHIFIFSHPYWLKNWRKEQIVIHTTHSASQLKKDSSDPVKISDYVLVCSDSVKEERKKAFLIPEDNLLVIGEPRIDLLYKHNECINKLIPNYRGQKVILSMETFKQTKYWTDSDDIDAYAINVVKNINEMKKLDEFLDENQSILIVKVHHLQDMSFLNVEKFKNIYYINDNDLKKIGVQTNELLENADGLLTDYSSVFYEFLLLNRPIGFLLGDMKSYSRGFNMENPLEFMPGTKIYNFENLIKFIINMDKEKEKFENERKRICELTFKYQDNRNSERLWNWLNENCLREKR